MTHVRPLTKSVDKAYGLSVGHYLLVGGQVLGILALLLIDKSVPVTPTPTPDPPSDETEE